MLSSPLHQNQTAEPSSQSVPIQSQSSLPITMSGTTTIASTTTTIPSGTRGGSLSNTQQAAQVATTAEQRIATAFATAFNQPGRGPPPPHGGGRGGGPPYGGQPGGNPPGGQPTPQQPIAQAADLHVMGMPPQPFTGNRDEAEDFFFFN